MEFINAIGMGTNGASKNTFLDEETYKQKGTNTIGYMGPNIGNLLNGSQQAPASTFAG